MRQPAAKAAYPDVLDLVRRVDDQLSRTPVFVRLKSRNGSTIRYLLQRHDAQLLAAALIDDPASAARVLAIYRSLDTGADPGLDRIPARFLPEHLADPGQPITLQGMSVAINVSSGMTQQRRALINEQARTALLGRYLGLVKMNFDGLAS